MAVEWTGWSPEVLLRLDRDSREPLGAQLQGRLRDAIRSGRLSPGERLPSSRVLAGGLSVSRGLVTECYAQLEAEGYLSTRPGSATRVAPAPASLPAPAGRAPARNDAVPPRLAADFRPAVPDLASFPMRDWLWAMGEAGRRAPVTAAGYGDPRGSAELRRVLAAYLRRVRGAVADPEHLVICSGFTQGVGLLLRALARDGITRVAVEDPGDRDNDTVAERAGLTAVPVPVDELGADVAALRSSGARAVILTPAHQTPTGVVLAPERRQALMAWAAEAQGVIIEDDYDAEFRYDRQPVGALQGLDPGRVASLGSVSKSLAPFLRLGWIACPPGLADAVSREKQIADRGSPGLDQLALARLIESGRYDKHLRRMRAVYAARRAALVQALAQHAPGLALTGLAAGFHAVARLPATTGEQAVIAAARERSVGLTGMSRYRPDGAAGPPELVIGFGNLTENAIRHGVAAIGDLLRGEPGSGPPR